jgi:hypothetical protein
MVWHNPNKGSLNYKIRVKFEYKCVKINNRVLCRDGNESSRKDEFLLP